MDFRSDPFDSVTGGLRKVGWLIALYPLSIFMRGKCRANSDLVVW